MAKKCNKSLEETHRLLLELAKIGVCKVWHEEEQELFLVNIFAPGILEWMVNNREQIEAHPEVGRGFEEYTRKRLCAIASLFPEGMAMMRVIPVEAAIKDLPDVEPWEKLSFYLDKYNQYAVGDCSCRASRRIREEGCGHLEHEVCLQLGPCAEYYVRTGRARAITREEAEAIIKSAEANGMMHEMAHTDGLEEFDFICNCCGCACFAIRIANLFKTPEAVRSNYGAVADAQKCVACGQCVETCPTNALRLGQRLCAKEELPKIEERKAIDHIWSEKDWNKDYLINREDVLPEGTAPCKTTCPAHIAVQGYIKLAAEGRYLEALALIKKENPFPAVCGRICPHDCESECTRSDIDAPIAIDEVKRFIADLELKQETRFVPTKLHDYKIPVAVVGAGPAGLSCAYYLAAEGYAVTVFEKQEKLGGMLTLGIPAFRLEKTVVEAEIDILRELGVQFQTSVEVGKDISLNQLREQGFKAFYLAIGVQGGRALGIENETAEGMLSGVEFLRNVNLGHGKSLSGRTVVIGGGQRSGRCSAHRCAPRGSRSCSFLFGKPRRDACVRGRTGGGSVRGHPVP